MKWDYRDKITRLIEDMYSERRLRPLVGEDSILLRTLGLNYPNLEMKLYYYDVLKGRSIPTELTEALEALANFDGKPNDKNAVLLYLEVADIAFQREVMSLHFQQDALYNASMRKFDKVLKFFRRELEKRELSFEILPALMRVKYTVRLLYDNKTNLAKHQEAELKQCLRLYLRSKRKNKI